MRGEIEKWRKGGQRKNYVIPSTQLAKKLGFFEGPEVPYHRPIPLPRTILIRKIRPPRLGMLWRRHVNCMMAAVCGKRRPSFSLCIFDLFSSIFEGRKRRTSPSGKMSAIGRGSSLYWEEGTGEFCGHHQCASSRADSAIDDEGLMALAEALEMNKTVTKLFVFCVVFLPSHLSVCNVDCPRS